MPPHPFNEQVNHKRLLVQYSDFNLAATTNYLQISECTFVDIMRYAHNVFTHLLFLIFSCRLLNTDLWTLWDMHICFYTFVIIDIDLQIPEYPFEDIMRHAQILCKFDCIIKPLDTQLWTVLRDFYLHNQQNEPNHIQIQDSKK